MGHVGPRAACLSSRDKRWWLAKQVSGPAMGVGYEKVLGQAAGWDIGNTLPRQRTTMLTLVKEETEERINI